MVTQFSDTTTAGLIGNSDGISDTTEILAGVDWAEQRVKSTLGFGVDESGVFLTRRRSLMSQPH